MKLNTVAITGMGAICGLGHNLKECWDHLIAGKSGIREISHPRVDQWPIKIGGQVKDFQIAEDLLSSKERDRFDLFIHFALKASQEALIQSLGPEIKLPYDPLKMGTIIGVGMGGLPLIESNHELLLSKGARRVSPFFIPGTIPNMAPGMISLNFGLKGINYSVTSACSSSAHALACAFDEIALGRHEMIVAGGSEGVISPLPIAGFTNMKALSKTERPPHEASRPFDVDRDGFVIGEGAGVLVLENYEGAKARGAQILGILQSHASTSDTHHITAPHPEGLGAQACMSLAVQNAGISVEDIGHINAHGTSTPLGDIAETKAIKGAFGQHAYHLIVNSTKSMTGHLLGAAGSLESIFTVMALKEGVIPPTINLLNQDPECDLNYAPNKPVQKQMDYALSNSFGFGGTNCSLVFKKEKV